MIHLRLARRLVSGLIVLFAVLGFLPILAAQELARLQKFLTCRIEGRTGPGVRR